MSWPTVAIKRVARLGTGHTPSRQHPEYWENCKFPWLTLADVWQLRDGTRNIVEETSEMISDLGVRNSSAVVHPAGTVALSRTASVGFSCIFGRPMATSQDFATWTCGADLQPRFLLWVLRGSPAQIRERMTGSTHQTIYMPDIETLRTPLPPVEVQTHIAEFLDRETARIDALITKKHRMIELSNLRWKRKLLDLAAPHLGGRPVPDGWTQARLRNLVDRVVGGSWGAEPGETEVDAPCIRSADFNFPRLSANGGAVRSYGLSEMQSRIVRQGDLVIEKSGGGDETPVGRVVMWLGEQNAVPTNFAARLRPTEPHDPWFVLLAFRAAYESGLNWRSIKQTTGIQNLDTGAYLSESWPIPPVDEQRRVASDLCERLESTMNLSDVLQRQIGLLREHRQVLITAAVTGELEIPGVAA